MPFPKIAIVGAGPVGTTLARLLLLQAPSSSVTVFEGEPSPDYRSQGGTLDLHTETGLAALKEAGLWDEFLKHARYDGEALLITDKNLKPYVQVKPSRPTEQRSALLGGQRPEIDRAALRQMLTESLPPGMIKWGHRLVEVRHGASPQDNELVFTLAAGGTASLSGFDLVVGADGAWSRVRSALADVRPQHAGVSIQTFEIPDAAATAPDVYRAVNRGSLFSHADGLRASLHQMGDGSLLVAVSFRTDGDDDDDKLRPRSGALDLERNRAAALARLDGWHPLIREAVSRAGGGTAARGLYMLPVGFRFAHARGVTVVGDAAHLMTPFAGEGVNVGMEDARRLAGAIVAAAAAGEDGPVALDGGVAAFEADMFARAAGFAALTEAMLRHWFFSEDCPRSVVPSAMATQARFHAPKPLGPLLGGLTYGYFALRNLVW